VKCTDAGGTITVEAALTTTPDPRARLQPRDAHLRVSVTDTGEGIPPDKLRAIFEPFVQAESGHTRPREGSGLGLTIGRRLARAMGGDLTVDSTLGEGSAFSLWLPALTAAAEQPLAEPQTAGTETGDGPPPAERTSSPRRDVKGLGEVSRGLLSQLAPLVEVVVERLRGDPTLPMAAGLRTSQVADHLSTLLADIASALLVVEEAAGETSPLLADAIEIQRLVAERHGAQRARLGWKEAQMRREFMILREELERVVRRAVPLQEAREAAGVVATVNRFVDQVEYIAVRAMEKERDD
jgi:signal transduction histidine kinase